MNTRQGDIYIRYEETDRRRLRALRLAVLAAAIIFIIAGIRNGSMQDVLLKATRICTECIGLG